MANARRRNSIRSKISQLLGRRAGGGAKLVVIAYDHAGHYFHELLGYMTAASVLGVSLRIIAARLVDPAIAAQLHAERTIDSLPHTWAIHPPNVVDQLVGRRHWALGAIRDARAHAPTRTMRRGRLMGNNTMSTGAQVTIIERRPKRYEVCLSVGEGASPAAN
jgi:hypothetical protein